MYNETQKQQFIEECIQSDTSRRTAVYLFNAIEQHEISLGKDCCAMSAEELQQVLGEVFGIRTNTKTASMSYLRTYAKWCLEHGIDGACDALIDFSVDSSDKIRSQMVQSPLQLQRYLNLLFAPEEEESIDVLYRCFLWCAFIGIAEKDIENIRADDVDLQAMTVRVDEKQFRFYPEAMQTFQMAKQLTSFSYHHKNYGTIRRERNEGAALFRGYKGETKLHTMRIRISGEATRAVKDGKTKQRLSYDKVRLSGLFYRIYERECTGLPVDFGYIAAQAIEERLSGKNNPPDYLRMMRVKKKRELMHDYENWKKAFML